MKIILDYQSANHLAIIGDVTKFTNLVIFEGDIKECESFFNRYTLEQPYEPFHYCEEEDDNFKKWKEYIKKWNLFAHDNVAILYETNGFINPSMMTVEEISNNLFT